MPDPRLSLTQILSFIAVAILMAVLYVGRDFFIPIAIAVMIAFLLAPLVRRLESWHFSRIPAVITVSVLAGGFLAFAIYIVAGQVVDLAQKLPNYKGNLLAKVAVFKVRPDSSMARVTETLHEVAAELAENEKPTGVPATKPQPLAVEVVARPDTALTMLRSFVTPLLAPLGQAAIIIIFVIFILLGREDLRDRFIHLIGHGRLQLTTQVLDEAAERVSRYLIAQLIVNVTYGIPIGLGLMFIGVPNAILWGFLATVLRFIPYIGPWIAASFPIILSVAIATGWWPVAMTVSLFVVIELISNNAVEPWLYGTSTGLSPMAIIVSAVFWTSLWGAGGLLLATPLTVCIAVLGKYVPSLSFLDVLLGDKPPIAPEDRLYQRLLAGDELEVYELAENFAKEHSLNALFDELIGGALRLIENDFHHGTLDEAERKEIYRLVRGIIVDLDLPNPPITPIEAEKVSILPAYTEADEMAALMLGRLLSSHGVKAEVLSAKNLTSEMVERAVEDRPRVVCISAATSGSVIAAANLCKRLRYALSDSTITIGLWGGEKDEAQLERLRRADPKEIFTSLKSAESNLVIQSTLEPESLQV